jgi:hypothetical protein
MARKSAKYPPQKKISVNLRVGASKATNGVVDFKKQCLGILGFSSIFCGLSKKNKSNHRLPLVSFTD